MTATVGIHRHAEAEELKREGVHDQNLVCAGAQEERVATG